MGTLTVVGLALNMVGAFILLGPAYSPIEQILKKFDPFYISVKHGVRALKEVAGNENVGLDADDRVKMENIDSIKSWKLAFLPLKWFINRRSDDKIHLHDDLTLIELSQDPQTEDHFYVMDSDGDPLSPDTIFCNGEPISIGERRMVSLPDGGAVGAENVTLEVVHAWLEEAQTRRMYRVGISLLVIGLFLQLLAHVI